MANKQQVVNRAANDLGLLRLGQSLAAQDNARIHAGYDEVYAQLSIDGLASWEVDADVPTDLVPHIVALVCENCLNTYGVSPERYQRIMGAINIARAQIRSNVENSLPSTDCASDY